jgi:hypothetical protein
MIVPNLVADEILQWRRRRPFIPFIIILSNGERCVVSEPTALATDRQRIVVLERKRGSKWFRVDDVVAIRKSRMRS